MRLAFASDMHGNLPAFEAVLAEIDRQQPFDGVYGGGDYVVNGLYPAQCVQHVIDRGWQSVRGNADDWAVSVARQGNRPPGRTPEESEELEPLVARGRWTVDRLSDEQIDFLEALPESLTFTGPSGQTLMLVHATPWSIHYPVRQDADDSEKRKMLDRAGSDALLYGHIHYAYQEEIDGRTICCMGAVGLPYDGDPRASFVIATDEGQGWSFEHVRVAYDNEAYAREVEASGMPLAPTIATLLRKASP